MLCSVAAGSTTFFAVIVYLLSTACLQHPAVTTTLAAVIPHPPPRSPSAATSYKPVILVHGIMGNASHLDALKDAIAAAHPGTVIYDTNYYTNQKSLTDLWTQGGLVVRGILQTINDLNVRNFISLSSPQNGQYGEDEIKWFPRWAKKNLHILLYTPLGQKISVGNYWRDPHHLPAYSRSNIYLPVLNNESVSLHADSWQFKKNFLRIQKLVLIGGKDDGVITPYQSAFFGAYDETESVIDATDMDIYTQDYFGLKTLDERGAVFVHNVSGVEHHTW